MKKTIYSIMLAIALSTGAYASAEEKLLEASNTFKNILRDSKTVVPKEVFAKAQAIAIFPATIEISMFLGGKSGDGVMVVRKSDGTWSYPFFVELGGAGIGLQLGVEKKDILMIFQTKDAVQKMMDNKMTLGADASVAIGPAGESAGRGSETDFQAEVYTYTKTSGLFVGVSLDGSVLRHNYDQDVELYGNGMLPEQIIASESPVSSYAMEDFLKAISQIH